MSRIRMGEDGLTGEERAEMKKIRDAAEEESKFTAENRESKALVSLGGLSLTRSGKLTRSGYFRFLDHDLDDYHEVQMTDEQAKKVHHHLEKLSTGSSAMVPLFCGGSKCPFSDRCPLYKMNLAPISKACPIEGELLKEFTFRYFTEYDVDPNNFTEVGYVNELAEIEIYLMRLNMSLAKSENAEIVIEQAIGIDNEGVVAIQKQLSPFMEQKERLHSRRARVVKLMVGDRQEKYKKEAALKVHIEDDPSSMMATMRSQLDQLKAEMDKKNKPSEEDVVSAEDIIDATFVED